MTHKELKEMKQLVDELWEHRIVVDKEWEEEFSIHDFLKEFETKVDPDKENEKYIDLCNKTLVKYIKLVALNYKKNDS